MSEIQLQTRIFKRLMASVHYLPHTTPTPTSPFPTLPMVSLPVPISRPSTPSRTRHAIPSVYMRSGTSKGLFFHRHHLPPLKSDWAPILLSAMGSKEGDRRQLNGIGGGSSTTSKVAVVERSRREGIDVDYTFVQVGLSGDGEGKVDFSGNCGNMASGVGPFAVDEGLVGVEEGLREGEVVVRVFNTNTQRVVEETVLVDEEGRAMEEGDFSMPGVKGTGSPIKVAFIKPAGSMTRRLFPSGKRQEWLEVRPIDAVAPFTVRASLIDAANPFVFVDSATLPELYHQLGPEDEKSLAMVEAVRREAALRMSLATSALESSLVRGTPKIAVLSTPRVRTDESLRGTGPDIEVTSFSMGKVHPSLQLTGAVCLSAAVSLPGTVASELSERRGYSTPPGSPSENCDGQEEEPEMTKRTVVIKHCSGEISAEVHLGGHKEGEENVDRVTVVRTARRLFEGSVFFNS